jgi:hypothetical protein
MRLRDYFVTSRNGYGFRIMHKAVGCEWVGELLCYVLDVDDLMSLVARHDEDCPCAEG